VSDKGWQALEAIAGETRDAVLLDDNLGGARVDAVAAALTRGPVPFVFVTGDARGSLPAAIRAAPMLPKPFSEADLVAALHGLLAPTTASADPLRRSLGGAG
jgi:DNA-binding LytR/AlgR family response regulator